MRGRGGKAARYFQTCIIAKLLDRFSWTWERENRSLFSRETIMYKETKRLKTMHRKIARPNGRSLKDFARGLKEWAWFKRKKEGHS